LTDDVFGLTDGQDWVNNRLLINIYSFDGKNNLTVFHLKVLEIQRQIEGRKSIIF